MRDTLRETTAEIARLRGGVRAPNTCFLRIGRCDVLSKAPAQFAAHGARGQEFYDSGSLLAYGPFGNRQEEGSMAVFTSRQVAEEFAREDPFVVNGVVCSWHVRERNEAFLP